MSQAAPRRAERRQSGSPALELKRKMQVLVEKDVAIDKLHDINAGKNNIEVADKSSEHKEKETRNGDAERTHNGKAGAVAGDKAAIGNGDTTKVDKDKRDEKKVSGKDDKKTVSKDEDKKAAAKEEDKKTAAKDDKKTVGKEDKKAVSKDDKDSAKREDEKTGDKEDKKSGDKEDKESSNKEDIPNKNGDDSVVQEVERRKVDTNYSLSRVKISPYRRGHPAGHTGHASLLCPADGTLSPGDCSTQANYAGNNSTMEADLSVSSVLDTPERSVRSVRGRASYRKLPELILSRPRDSPGVGVRPTAPVVGRKRPAASSASGASSASTPSTSQSSCSSSALKRPRLAQLVGINSDLPLVGAGGSTLDTLKPPGCSSSDCNSSQQRRCSIV